MARMNFYAVTELPGVLVADSFYYVENGSYAESYVTNSTGTARMIGNSTMINALIAQALANWEGGGNQLQIVADIAARDALAVGATANIMALVLDASADPTVDAGSALYAYSVDTSTWYKIAEYESMDVVVQWANIQGGPTSTPAQIDTSVSQSHSHSNKSVLDELTEDASGDLLFKGQGLATQWAVKDW